MKLKDLLFKIQSRLISNSLYAWYITRIQRQHDIEKRLRKVYSKSPNTTIPSMKAYAICLYEGFIYQGGLADRLRGIISTYQICKQLNLQFKLYFVHPFCLTDYLQPNKYDWVINNESVIHHIPFTKVLILDSTQDSTYQFNKQKQWLIKHLKQSFKQCHIYTNAAFSYQSNYAESFNELFKLSPRLQAAIEKQKAQIGNKYISTSFRFLNLLNDFNETFGANIKLTTQEREELINKNLKQLCSLHKKYHEYKILVNSDSISFLSEAKKLPFVYVNPGNITHIDNEGNATYEKFEKTFLDFFMIANADKVFLLRTGRMHKSGYPYAASLIYNKPFQIINF